jgi:O-antigen/teichoic acid export membrane protein
MLSGWGAISLVILLNIIVTPIVLNNVGKELYGIWFLIFNIISYFYLADFGITSAITRLYAKYKVIGEKKVQQLISASYLLVVGLDVLLVLLLYFSQNNISEYLEIKEKNLTIFRLLFLVALFEFGTQFILRVNIGILKGMHKIDIAYNLEALTALIRLSSILILLVVDSFSIFSFALSYSLSKIIADSISIFYISSNLNNIEWSYNKYIFKELFDLGSSSLVTSITSTIFSSLPLLLFGKFFGVEKVFIYAVPFAVMILLSRLINVIYHGVTPRASELKTLNDENEIYKISSFGVKFSVLISFFSLSFFIIFGKEVLLLWLGNETLNGNDFVYIYNILILLLTYLSLTVFQKINILIYRSTGIHWIVTLESITSMIMLLTISYILLDMLNMYVFAVSMICVGIFKYLYYQFSGKSKVKTYSLPVPILMMLLVFIGSIYFINLFLLISILFKFLLFILSSMLFILYVYFKLFNEYERHEIKSQLAKLK